MSVALVLNTSLPRIVINGISQNSSAILKESILGNCNCIGNFPFLLLYHISTTQPTTAATATATAAAAAATATATATATAAALLVLVALAAFGRCFRRLLPRCCFNEGSQRKAAPDEEHVPTDTKAQNDRPLFHRNRSSNRRVLGRRPP